MDHLIAAGEDHQKSSRRAFGVPSLRPYLPRRRHLRRVLGGLVVLAGMAWKGGRAGLRKAIAPPEPKTKQAKAPEKPKSTKAGEKKEDELPGLVDALERAAAAALIVVMAVAAAAGVVSALWSQIAPYARTACGVATVTLLTAAWIVGPKPETAGEPELPADGGEALPDPAPLPQDVAPLRVDPVAAAVRQLATPRGWKGAHLDDVLALLPGHSRTELLEVLAEAGIPVENQLKLTLPGGRQRNRQGIRLSTLPPAPDQPAAETPPAPPSPAAVEVAAEPAPLGAHVTVYGIK
ncbi:hypothetical protein V2S66_03370 [Streptomyces sp. V4-01]|uniref:PASTA domain-containing protein n=1 Tax=Actinacidiphila polyblastidii TaxID=3110430 RepID=A0ABU7P5C1_9ACTN|nr:hypothetical protein [Streptomyces sp. V4-01]